MFLINYYIKRVLLFVIFFSVASSKFNAFSNEQEITHKSKPKIAFNCLCRGFKDGLGLATATFGAIQLAVYLQFFKEESFSLRNKQIVIASFGALGLITGIVSQYNKEQKNKN